MATANMLHEIRDWSNLVRRHRRAGSGDDRRAPGSG
jgi:hypothetical protein